MSKQHTPGPWRVTHIGTHASPNNHVHTFEVYTDPTNEHDNAIGSANARLIAAAPELLEALKELHVLLDEHEPNWYLKLHDNHAKTAIKKAVEG